jgi:hypothetical protein
MAMVIVGLETIDSKIQVAMLSWLMLTVTCDFVSCW